MLLILRPYQNNQELRQMLPQMTNFSRFSIYNFRNICEITGIDPDGRKREPNRRRREESFRAKVYLDIPNTRAPSERRVSTLSTTLLPSE
jgi:hypothetical protein